jgi:hypothetical protein
MLCPGLGQGRRVISGSKIDGTKKAFFAHECPNINRINVHSMMYLM